MGKYMQQCEGNCEVAVMEVPEDGVRTKARALGLSAVNSTTAKRRKVDDEEVNLSSSVSHLSSRRRFVITSDAGNSVQQTGSNDQWSSASSDYIPGSCCSSNRSTEEESAQIEPSTCSFDGRQSRETTPSSELRSTESGELESTARPLEANSSRQTKVEEKSSADKLKDEIELNAEIEEFFLAQEAEEKQLLKQFSKKYNFDFEIEKPMEGRFEWVKLKP